jgi:ABC-type branched-subunit amino acid transport system substrate-binding protein
MRSRGFSLVAALCVAAGTLAACGSSSHSSTPSSTSPSASSSTSTSSSFYKMSTSNCTNPSAVTKKITGTLTVGFSGPYEGPIAPFADAVVQGMKDRFAVANKAGGIGGVKLAVQPKNDNFNPALAKQNVDSWISSGAVQAFDLFGSGPLAAVAADQNLACLPLLFASATQDAYRNIAKYPWTTEFLPSNNVEEVAEVKTIQNSFPGAKTITMAIAEDETGSGASYLEGMQYAVKGTNVKIVKVVPFSDPSAAAISLKQTNADVVFGALVVPECLELTEALAKAGYTPKLVVQASNCGSASLMFAPAGAAANGQKLVFWEKDPGNPVYAHDAGFNDYVKDAESVDPKAKTLVDNTYYETGWMIGDMDVNIFQTAAASSLGLSEVGIMQAARNQNYQEPLFINGIRWIMNANEAYGITKLQPLQYVAATKSFKYDGAVIDTCSRLLPASDCTGGL